MKRTFVLPCYWQMYSPLRIEAETIDEAIQIACGPVTALPEGSYVSDSFTVERDAVTEEASEVVPETC